MAKYILKFRLLQHLPPTPAVTSHNTTSRLWDLAHTAVLFTWTDYKTIFLPVTIFASATAPVNSVEHLLRGCFWIWWHQFLCNVSNQAGSKEEDIINHPWRPLPSGRISVDQAVLLRKGLVVACLALSSLYGMDLVATSTGLVCTTILYDGLGFAAHPVGKNFCNIWGYTLFQIGATKLMGASRSLDRASTLAVILSGLTIFTTIQTQDFPDVVGDAAVGRTTFPLYAPRLSRWFTCLALILWSLLHCWVWTIGVGTSVTILLFGAALGIRYLWCRTPKADKRSYRIYNIWLVVTFLLPLHARTNVFSF